MGNIKLADKYKNKAVPKKERKKAEKILQALNKSISKLQKIATIQNLTFIELNSLNYPPNLSSIFDYSNPDTVGWKIIAVQPTSPHDPKQDKIGFAKLKIVPINLSGGSLTPGIIINQYYLYTKNSDGVLVPTSGNPQNSFYMLDFFPAECPLEDSGVFDGNAWSEDRYFFLSKDSFLATQGSNIGGVFLSCNYIYISDSVSLGEAGIYANIKFESFTNTPNGPFATYDLDYSEIPQVIFAVPCPPVWRHGLMKAVQHQIEIEIP